jgi:hypothetical protein
MLRAMDDLERAVNNLLRRLREENRTVPGTRDRRPGSGEERVESKNPEAVELIRHAIKRLKSI